MTVGAYVGSSIKALLLSVQRSLSQRLFYQKSTSVCLMFVLELKSTGLRKALSGSK